jgi:hypothetical protein
MTSYLFTNEPSARALEAIFRHLTSSTTVLNLIVLDEPNVEQSSVLARLRSGLVADKQVSEWAGTQLLGRDRRAVRFQYLCTPAVVNEFLSLTKSLSDWRPPLRPIDPHITRSDGSTLFGSVISENDYWLDISNREITKLRSLVPDINSQITLDVRSKDASTPDDSTLVDESDDIRWQAARRLAQALISPEELLEGTRNLDWRVRYEVIDRLSARARDDSRTIDRLIAMLRRDNNAWVREKTALALSDFLTHKAAQEALKASAQLDENVDVRSSASLSLYGRP